jgi:hypothetical protein
MISIREEEPSVGAFNFYLISEYTLPYKKKRAWLYQPPRGLTASTKYLQQSLICYKSMPEVLYIYGRAATRAVTKG